MANPKCVSVKCEAKDKDLFDKDLKDPILKQVRETVETLVDKDKSKTVFFDKNCKDGWLLTVTLVALSVDDPDKPTTMEAKVSIDGVPLFATKNGFKASGKAKASGIRAKKLKEDATSLVNDVVEDVMKKQVLPEMTKP